MYFSRYAAALIFAGLTVGSVQAVSAQEDKNLAEYVPEGEIKAEEGKRQGLDGTFRLSASVNMVSNRHVVGQTDGFSTLVGLGLLGGIDYIHKRHEWRNTLSVTEAWARTPVIDEFVKSDDVVDLESLYHYFFVKRAGAFGRLNANTSMFKTEVLTAEPVNYVIARPDGDVDLREDVERLRLADAFQPLTLNESVGLFAEPVTHPRFNMSLRAGVGARETFANGVLVVQDDADTAGLVEVTDLSNPDSKLTVFQGGLEGFLGFDGKFENDRIFYDVGLSALVPFLNNDAQDRSATELTRLGVAGMISFAVFEWMSINYKLRILRDPQLLDELQVQNNLLLTFNYTFVERAKVDIDPTPTPGEVAATKRATEAEERAVEAEAKAADLERQLAAEKAEPEVAPEPKPEAAPVTPEPQPEPQQ